MALDATKIGNVVAAQMEALEGRFGDDCEMGNVCTIVEVIAPDSSSVWVRHSPETRPHALLGLIKIAEITALNDLHAADPNGD